MWQFVLTFILAAAAGGRYEYNASREMARIEKDYKDGKVDQREYEIHKDQIQSICMKLKPIYNYNGSNGGLT